MRRPRVVVTNRVHPDTANLLARRCELIANDRPEPLTRDEIIQRTAEVEALMVFMPDSVDDELLAACPNLVVIAGALKGRDNFDVEACTRRGVWFTVVPDLLSAPTAELAVGLLIGLLRRIPEGDRQIREGGFQGWRPELYGRSLDTLTVGFIGMGGVGRELAMRLKPFGSRLAYHDPRQLPANDEAELELTRVGLADLLATSDAVIPLTPLTDETIRLIDRAAIAAMKPGGVIVNVGRGSVVDERAVADAIESGHLAGYAADVFAMEDWAQHDRPREIEPRLRAAGAPTLFTPHLGSAVVDARRRIELTAAQSILDAFGGRHPRGALNEPAAREGRRAGQSGQPGTRDG